MEALTMSTISNESSGASSPPEGASDAFLDFIEECYSQWEREFAEEVHLRRTTTSNPKR
jgi:hypothetical protein